MQTQQVQEKRTPNPPDLVGPQVKAYFGKNKNTGVPHLAIYIPGCDPVYLPEVPEDKRGEKTPLFRGRAGAVWRNERDDTGDTYYTFRSDVFPRGFTLIFNEDE